MIGRTGIYRVRKGLLGKCILQYQSRTPIDIEISGYKFTWYDENFENAPVNLTEIELSKGYSK